MSNWHQCTGEPPRESEAEALPGRALTDYIRDASRRVEKALESASLAAIEDDVRAIMAGEDREPSPLMDLDKAARYCKGLATCPLEAGERKRLSRYRGRIAAMQAELAATEQAPAEPPAPEARCPECGGACEFDFASWGCRASEEKCGIGELSDHEVWRRWGDTDKAAGVYWMPCGVVLVGSNGYCSPGRRGVYPMADDFWVLGPLPEPHAPGVE